MKLVMIFRTLTRGRSCVTIVQVEDNGMWGTLTNPCRLVPCAGCGAVVVAERLKF